MKFKLSNLDKFEFIVLIIGLIITWGFNNIGSIGSWMLGLSLGSMISQSYTKSLDGEQK